MEWKRNVDRIDQSGARLASVAFQPDFLSYSTLQILPKFVAL